MIMVMMMLTICCHGHFAKKSEGGILIVEISLLYRFDGFDMIKFGRGWISTAPVRIPITGLFRETFGFGFKAERWREKGCECELLLCSTPLHTGYRSVHRSHDAQETYDASF